MRIPRTKYGLSFTEIAKLTGKNRSAVVREADKDPESFQAKVNKLIGGRGVSSAPKTVVEYGYWNTKTGERMTAWEKVDELIFESEAFGSAIFCLLVILCDLVPCIDKSSRKKLAFLFQQAREILRAHPHLCDHHAFDLSAPEVSEAVMEKFFEPAIQTQ